MKKEGISIENSGEKLVNRKAWAAIIIFGLLGQMAWTIKNMFLNLYVYNYLGGTTDDIALVVSTSAVMAAVATLAMGIASDRKGNRKLFMCIGYILWGFATAAYGLADPKLVAAVFPNADLVKTSVFIVVIVNCVMAFLGSTATDCAYNAWITDITDRHNRGKVESVVQIFPLLALLIVFGCFDSMTKNGQWNAFFIIVGAIKVVTGAIGFFIVKDNATKTVGISLLQQTLYGFLPSTIKANKELYLWLAAFCIFSTADNVFMPYILIYMEKGLGIENYAFLIAGIIVAAAACSVLVGSKIDKIGKAKFIIPAFILMLAGLLGLYFLKVMAGFIIFGTVMMAAFLIFISVMNAFIRDVTPKGKVGLFQGIRIIFTVTIPMIIGPYIGAFAIRNSGSTYLDMGTEKLVPDSTIFLAAAIVTMFAIVPMAFLLKKHLNLSIRRFLLRIRDVIRGLFKIPEKRYANVDEYIAENKHKKSEFVTPLVHFTPPIGWLNDPNGLCQYKGVYQLFYQHNPFDVNWGTMSWGHATSTDLIDWKHEKVALIPDMPYDKGAGVWSGCAVVEEDKLYLFYTAANALQQQAMAELKDGKFVKNPNNPIIRPKDIEEVRNKIYFRDPKVIKYKDKYYMAISSSEKGKGIVFFFESANLYDWQFLDKLVLEDCKGGIECPDIFFLDNRFVLLFSYKGIKWRVYDKFVLEGGKVLSTGALTRHGDVSNACYAPQTFLDDKGRRIYIAWVDTQKARVGLEKYNFNSAMSIPAELRIIDDKLCFQPVEELQKYEAPLENVKDKLYNEEISFEGSSFDITAEVQGNATFSLLNDSQSQGGIKIQIKDNMLTMEGTKLSKIPFSGGNIRIIVDNFIAEIFYNGMMYTICTTNIGEIYNNIATEGTIKLKINRIIKS